MCTDTGWEGVKKSPSSGERKRQARGKKQWAQAGTQFGLNSRKTFSTVKVAGYCKKLLREVVVFILGDTQNLTGYVPEQPALANLDLSRGWDWMVSRGLSNLKLAATLMIF